MDLASKVLARGALSRWWSCPACWARECLSVHLSEYQVEVLDELPRRSRIALRGPHGLGKSFLGSVVVLWFASTRDLAGVDWKIITTASAWRHLEVYLWPEIHKWANRIEFETLGRSPFDRRRELMDLRLKLGHGAATAVASNDPAKIEGAHADSLLYLLDEAKTIPPPTWDSVEGAFSGAGMDTGQEAFAIAMSTPGPPTGRFYDIHRRAPGYEDWWTRHVTLEEAIAAGRISRQWAEQRALQWGPESAMYANRVLGEFHASDEDSVIPLAWIEAAVERWYEWDRAGRPGAGGPHWTGVDVGRGGDETVLASRDGPHVTIDTDRHRNTMTTVSTVQSRPGRAVVDVVGLGAGVYDRLREMHARPVAFTGSGRANGRDRSGKFGFTNVRSAAYWHIRELLDLEYEPTLALPPDDLMISDLTTPTWSVTSGLPPKIQVETKDKVVDRLGRSPDRGDAVVMSVWAERNAGKATHTEPVGTMPTTGFGPLGDR